MSADLSEYTRRGDASEMLLRTASVLDGDALAVFAAAVRCMDGDGVVPARLLRAPESQRWVGPLVDAGVLRAFPARDAEPAAVQVVHHYLFTEPEAPSSHRVYFIEDGPGGDIKIGRSHRVGDRRSDLQTATPRLLRVLGHVNGGPTMEAILRDRFRAHRIHGEWFRRNDELMSLIEESAKP
jgi:hypothetical protein